jgi:flagellar export protein FliJ
MFAPPFRFRLERVRVLRETREEVAKAQLAAAMSKLSASQDRLRVADEQLAKANAEHRSATDSGGLSGVDLIAAQAFLEQVEQQRWQGALERRRSESEVAHRGAELGHAAREHKALQRLKERHRAEHQRESARRESQALDEIAVGRFRGNAA